ncbi:MAG: ribonuclease HI [Syntrophomonadaceae bacterium]
MKNIIIYTDGACSGNPGPGGWAAVLLSQDKKKEIRGGERETTNQRMELKAVIEALRALKVKDWDVIVYSDSAYLVNAFQQKWLDKWQRNGWRNSKKEPVANQDLWQELLRLTSLNRVKIVKVKGHDGELYNERCDELARQAIKEL